MKHYTLSFLFTIISFAFFSHTECLAQKTPLSVIKNADLSNVWMNIRGTEENSGEMYMGKEPLGFIGQNYQRFYIHYNTILKDNSNPLVYNVYGKTRVKDNICNFEGAITIVKAEMEKVDEGGGFPVSELIKLTCNINYSENRNAPYTGFFSGVMVTYVYFDKNHQPHLSSPDYGDMESYNLTKATWTSYNTGAKKKCNWGVYRIPDCGDLDDGTGEFIVNPKYKDNGWIYFYQRRGNSEETDIYKIATRKEMKQWWNEK